MKLKTIVITVASAVFIASITLPAVCEEKTSETKVTGSGKGIAQSYRIGAGDVLKITTWKEPDFSEESVLVRTDGFIAFPLLNDVQAAGMTPMELKRLIKTSGIENGWYTVSIELSGFFKPFEMRFLTWDG